MCLYLAHCRYVPLGDLMVIFHIVLKAFVVVIRHFFTRYAANF